MPKLADWIISSVDEPSFHVRLADYTREHAEVVLENLATDDPAAPDRLTLTRLNRHGNPKRLFRRLFRRPASPRAYTLRYEREDGEFRSITLFATSSKEARELADRRLEEQDDYQVERPDLLQENYKYVSTDPAA